MPRTRLGVAGLVAFIGSAFIGFNSLVTSCASEHVNRDAAQLHAIEEQERFWTEAMQELSEVVKDKEKPESNYDARCRLLARRTAPFSGGQSLAAAPVDGDTAPPSQEVAELSVRVLNLQNEFAKQIKDPAVVGPRCSLEFEQRKQTEIAHTDALKEVAKEVAQAASADSGVPYQSIATRQDLITLSGPSKGIDVDVYWCESARDAQSTTNFKNALLLGQRLAGYATNGRKLSFGDQSDAVGQVRVRILPRSQLQPGSSYAPAIGRNVLRGESRINPFIRAIARDAREFGPADLANWTVAPPGSNPGHWYVAAAVCGASTPDPVALPLASTAESH
jgi:hypothetical protein